MQVFLNIVNKFFDPVIHMGSGVVKQMRYDDV